MIKSKGDSKLLELFITFLLFRLISLLAMKTHFLGEYIFVLGERCSRVREKFNGMKKVTASNFFLLIVGKVARESAEQVCANSRQEIETWTVSEPIRMPTILRSRTIHQPDRSQTSKKLADSSKPIATRRTLSRSCTFARFR